MWADIKEHMRTMTSFDQKKRWHIGNIFAQPLSAVFSHGSNGCGANVCIIVYERDLTMRGVSSYLLSAAFTGVSQTAIEYRSSFQEEIDDMIAGLRDRFERDLYPF